MFDFIISSYLVNVGTMLHGVMLPLVAARVYDKNLLLFIMNSWK